MLSLLYPFFLISSTVFISSSSSSPRLNCEFNEDCCWSSPNGQNWVKRHRIGINDYMRTFMVGRGRPPPKKNYIVRSQKKGESLYESCPFCTKNGIIHIQYRHWQSPSTDLRICWRESNDILSSDRCQKISSSRQSQLISQQIIVPLKKDVQISFILSRGDDIRSEAVAIIDKIIVKSVLCQEYNDTLPPAISAFPPSLPPSTSSIPSMEPSSPFLSAPHAKEIKSRDEESTVSLGEKKSVDTVTSTTFAAPSHPIPPSPSNPLNDLLGEDFVKFLDPNYETDNDYKEDEGEIGEEEIVTTTVTPPTTKSTVSKRPKGHHGPNRVSSIGDDECSTHGGCLFDRSFCSYKQPSGITQQSLFTITKIGTSSFAQVIVPSNNVSVLETKTSMIKDHVILYDVLLFEPNSRVAGCCFHPNKPLSCAYTLPTLMPLWQTARFDCKPGTTKLMFLCENYSSKSALCGLDNIRMHLMSDIFFLEPCQKRQLPHL